MRLIATAGISLMLGACSVGMAISGKKDPDLSVVRNGASRGNVESQIGKPIKSMQLDDGAKAETYEYVIGNEPSPARALGHAVADIFTLGLWEFAGTSIERSHAAKSRLTVFYDKSDTVTKVEPAEGTAVLVAAMSRQEIRDSETAARGPASRSRQVARSRPKPLPPPSSPPPDRQRSQTAPPAKGEPPDGHYKIQLAALRSRAGAEREWARLRSAWPEIFAERQLVIDKTNISGRGTYFRVQTGGFGTMQEARSMCKLLKAQKQPCFPAGRS